MIRGQHPRKWHGGRQTWFVVSAPRSGSTWLQHALNAHPEVFCTETRLFGHYADQVPLADGSHTTRITLDKYVDLLVQYYRFQPLNMNGEEYHAALLNTLIKGILGLAGQQSRARVLVDKVTPYRDTAPIVLDQIQRFLPKAGVVQLVRDGRDVLTSGVYDWIARNKKEHPRHARFVEGRADVVLERFFEDEDIEEWAALWTGPIGAMEALGTTPLTIRYEDMKQDFTAVLKNLFAHWRVQADDRTVNRCRNASSFEKMSGGRIQGEGEATAKVRKGVIGDWRAHFTRRDGELFERLAGPQLRAQGYEMDGRWVESLPARLRLGAEPKGAHAHYVAQH